MSKARRLKKMQTKAMVKWLITDAMMRWHSASLEAIRLSRPWIGRGKVVLGERLDATPR